MFTAIKRYEHTHNADSIWKVTQDNDSCKCDNPHNRKYTRQIYVSPPHSTLITLNIHFRFNIILANSINTFQFRILHQVHILHVPIGLYKFWNGQISTGILVGTSYFSSNIKLHEKILFGIISAWFGLFWIIPKINS